MKKITFLALHLNFGGIETVITNEANMLCNDFDVEIISLYKCDSPYKLDKKIKVTYLLDTISNRDIFLKSLKNLEIFNIFKEGFKAIKILIKKNKCLINAFENIDSDIIISTRKEFSKLLGKYYKKDAILIGQEHNYKLDDESYIKDVIKSNSKMDYFMPTSLELYNFYKDKISPESIYIPNVINFIPKMVNNLDNKKILSIGRLSKEKGYEDAILVMKKLVKEDKEYTLDIYGDGKEKDNLLKLIKDNNLENNVFLKGFVSPDNLNMLKENYALYLCTSHFESFGLAPLEAMAYGIVVAVFDSAKGLLEFVNEDNGIIAQNRDINLMASKILEEKNLIEKGKNARIKALEYSNDNIKIKLIDFIRSIYE